MKAGFLIFMMVLLLGCSSGHAAKAMDNKDYAQIQEQLLNKVYSTRRALVVLQDTGDILWSGEDRFKMMSSLNTSQAIQQIVMGDGFSLCLLEDGQIRYYGCRENVDFFEGKLDNVKMLAATWSSAHALFYDGTVRCLVDFKSLPAEVYDELAEWTDIVAIDAGISYLVGLRKDGTVLCIGALGSNEELYHVSEWTDIIQVAVGTIGVIGLKSDGTVVATGRYVDDGKSGTPPPMPAFDFSDWTDIVQVVAGQNYVAGLSMDGILHVEEWEDDPNIRGTKRVAEQWEDIVYIQGKTNFLVGIQKDGTVLAVGDLQRNKIDVEGWKAFTAE